LIGRRKALAEAIEKFEAEIGFKLPKLSANRRLRGAERLRGSSSALVDHHSIENFNLTLTQSHEAHLLYITNELEVIKLVFCHVFVICKDQIKELLIMRDADDTSERK
jgi:hypothetical protein